MSAETELQAVVDWVDEVGDAPAKTLARFAIQLGDTPIWPVWGDDKTDLQVFVDDLLAYLTGHWDALLLREVYPQGLRPARPSELLATAQEAVTFGPRNARSEELVSDALSFARAHDLSRCFGGLYELPGFWMVRQGHQMLIETAKRVEYVPLSDWLGFASALGDLIAERLLEADGTKWKSLVDKWHNRDHGDPIRIASLAIGHPREIASRLLEEELVPETSSVGEAANDNSGLRVAARMVGAIPYQSIKSVLSAAKAVPYRPSAELDALREALSEEMESFPDSAYPYEEGVHAANWIRQRCGIDEIAHVDPLEILERFKVAIRIEHIGPATLDALAIWGDAHGPAVIFNADSRKLARRSEQLSRRRLRISAAHELCHLVLDYHRTLAAVDILGSRIPPDAEARANAFAAEFLLPARTAVLLWRQSDLKQTREGISVLLDRLSDRFEVSRAVAGWQLDHGLAGSNSEIVFLLDELLDRR